MTIRTPLVLVNGQIAQLPSGDSISSPTNTPSMRGATSGIGGFALVLHFSLSLLVAGQRGFFGMADAGLTTNIDPTTSTTNGKIGIGINTNTGNWQLITNTAGSAPTVTDLGSSFPVNTTDFLELIIWCDPADTTIKVVLRNLTTPATYEATVSSNLPAAATYLTPVCYLNNNATASNSHFRFYGLSIAAFQ